MTLTFVLFLIIPTVLTKDCLLDVTAPDSPFIVNSTLTFPYYYYDQQIYEFKPEENFYLGCTKGTFSTYIAEKGDEMVCKNSTYILNTRTQKILDFVNIKCQPTPPTVVLSQNLECENNGYIYEIGVDLGGNFLSLITVCFDISNLIPFYCKYHNSDWETKLSRLQVNESNVYKEYVCDGNCNFADSGQMYPNLDDIFNEQEQILQNLGTTVNISLLKFPLTINTLYFLKYLRRGQHIQSVAAFDYINVVATWDLGEVLDNWITVLLMSSGLSSGSLYSGTLGVATLPNDDGELVEVYLNGGTIPVPKWLWTVFDYEDQILFFYNNPQFENGGEEITEVCSTWTEGKNVAIFVCSFKDVVDPDIRDFIENNFT